MNLKSLFAKPPCLTQFLMTAKLKQAPLVGKVLGERQDLRSKVKELSAVINTVVNEINRLPLADQKTIVEEKWPETQKKVKLKKKSSHHYLTLINTPRLLRGFLPTQTAFCIWVPQEP